MTSGIRTVIYPVKDLAQAKTLYGALLGVEPYDDLAAAIQRCDAFSLQCP